MAITRSTFRPIIILLVFFGVLFLLRGRMGDIFPKSLIPDSGLIGADSGAGGSAGMPGSAGEGDQAGNGTGTDSVIEKTKPVPGTSGASKGILTPTDKTISVEDSALSINGIVSFTNKERSKKQLPALKNNRSLNASAEKKLEDMFSNQYFEHQSPTGINVSDLIRNADYEYIVVGENLALGNFGGDQQVVTAWMNSPGHKANIMDPRFQEIGIAVGKGLYKGKEQWIAVQHFAKPLSSCPGPNSELKEKIGQHTSDLAGREKTLAGLKKEIDSSTTNDATYRANVEKYNNLVGEYNTYLESLKDEISRYNEQVRSFNSCAGLTAKKPTDTASVSQSVN